MNMIYVLESIKNSNNIQINCTISYKCLC